MQKKPLIALALLFLVVGVLGGTIAYFTSSATFNNQFNTKPYSTKVTETFESPDNWTPGSVTDKKVNVQNTGEVEIAVRVKLQGSWDRGLNGKVGEMDGQEDAAILNFASDYQTNWKKGSDGWYYYQQKLGQNATTTDLLESVKFNEKAVNTADCTDEGTVGQGESSHTCTSAGTGYDGAKYTLVVTVETLQADAVQTVWGTDAPTFGA